MASRAPKLTLVLAVLLSACGGGGGGNSTGNVTETNNTETVANMGPASQPDLQWGTHPIIADTTRQRYFLSPGSGFSTPQLLSGVVHGTDFQSLSINNQSVQAGIDFSMSIQHGDVLAVELQLPGEPAQNLSLVVTPLPLLAITADEIVDEPKLPGRYRWIDGSADNDASEQNLAIEIRGVTAQLLPKQPYGIEFRKQDNPDDTTNRQLLNLRSDDDWIADAAYRDLSFARNLVSHDLFRDMRPNAYMSADGPVGQSTVAGGMAELVMNRQYHGLYVIHERLDRKLLDLEKVQVPEDESGKRWDLVDFNLPENGSVLFKAQAVSADLYRPDQLEQDFEQKYPDPDNANRFGELQALSDIVSNTDDATFVQQIVEVIDIETMVDMWLLRLVTANADTLGKNYYLARNEADKWFFLPWDYDATFGVDWRGGEVYTAGVEFFRPAQNKLVRRLHSNPATGFNATAQTRWAQLRGTLFTASAIRARFDAYLAKIGVDTTSDVEHPRNRNLQRWPESGNLGAGNPTLGDAAFIELWLTDRLAFLDEKIAQLRTQ